MRFHLTQSSKNKKTGPMPVVTVSKDSCPPSCPLMNRGCYAETGPLALHWKRLEKEGKDNLTFAQFLAALRRLPHQIWRYGQAGDLPGEGDRIDPDMLNELAQANRHRPVIAYTHKPPTVENLAALEEAERLGFHVNASADDVQEADHFVDLGLSTVTVLPSEYGRRKNETLAAYRLRIRDLPLTTPKHRRIAICPATYTDTSCQLCRVCSRRRVKDTIVGFPAHGSRAKTVDYEMRSRTDHVP